VTGSAKPKKERLATVGLAPLEGNKLCQQFAILKKGRHYFMTTQAS